MKSAPLPFPPDPAWAYFLDVDGTLIEIAETPEAVAVPSRTIDIVRDLSVATGGAVALVSGRPIATLDHLFHPLRLPTAGLHGLELRDAGGKAELSAVAPAELGPLAEKLTQFSLAHPGVLIEHKGLTVALHYRSAPGAADAAVALAEQLAIEYRGIFALQRGKKVMEFRPPGAHKGDVVRSFMAQAPFAGRRPVFIGDDVTDEDGFADVNTRDGISIRIGEQADTAAQWRIADVPALIDWLAGIVPVQRPGGDDRSVAR